MIRPDQLLVLAADVVMVPVSRLDEQTRVALGDADEHGVALTLRTGRAPSTLVDEALAGVLDEFRVPSTVVDAIVRYSARSGADATAALDAAYPAVRRCFEVGYLVGADDDRARSRRLLLQPDEAVAGGRVVRCVQAAGDTEVHQVVLPDGRLVAVKVVGSQSGLGADALDREAAVLAHLDGSIAPALVGRGETDGAAWLAMEWCHGTSVSAAAAGLRGATSSPAALLRLAARVAEAYAALHRADVVHGDVHPGNVVVSPAGAVRLIDFGQARWPGRAGPAPSRGGVLQFYDPEQAAAALAGRPPEAATTASDVYSLGAVLHEVLTGRHHLDLSLERDVALRQITDRRSSVGSAVAPRDVTALVEAALHEDPAARITSADLAAGIARALPSSPAPTSALDQVLDGVLTMVRPGGAWFDAGLPATVPRCSVFYGAAGIAAAVRRIAVLRSDPSLLALADEWVTRGQPLSTEPDAFTSVALGVTERDTGTVSPFHRRSGVHAVDALISHARADEAGTVRAVTRFAGATAEPCTNLDLTLGRAGVLLTAAMLLETVGSAHHAAATLAELGNRTAADLWDELDRQPAIADATGLTYLGVAHGWAGVLLATLRWHAAAASAVPSALVDRLEQLAALARPAGLGAWWPATNRHDPRGWSSHAGGWCHGSAGFVHLWSSAAAVLGEPRWADLAERAGWDTYATRTDIGQLCCGSCGQAYALLALRRLTGNDRWSERAAEMALHAATIASSSGSAVRLPASLYKGDVAIAALAVDLDHPDDATMPFFGAAE